MECIRHWRIIEGDYTDAPDIEAHWHIDPPYQDNAGRHYRCNALDYQSLADWCRSRRGFVQACERDGATWLRLPFVPLKVSPSIHGFVPEAVWESSSMGVVRRR